MAVLVKLPSARWGNNRRLPGDEVWLVGEWHSSDERRYYTSLRALAAAIKARKVCEQRHQQLKQKLDLGRFEWLEALPRTLDRPAPARADDVHGLCLSAAPLPFWAAPGEVGKKIPSRVPEPPPSLTLLSRRAMTARLFADLVTPIRCAYCRRKLRPQPDLKLSN